MFVPIDCLQWTFVISCELWLHLHFFSLWIPNGPNVLFWKDTLLHFDVIFVKLSDCGHRVCFYILFHYSLFLWLHLYHIVNYYGLINVLVILFLYILFYCYCYINIFIFIIFYNNYKYCYCYINSYFYV